MISVFHTQACVPLLCSYLKTVEIELAVLYLPSSWLVGCYLFSDSDNMQHIKEVSRRL